MDVPDAIAIACRVVERYCMASAAGDLAGVVDCDADDFVLHCFGANPHTGDRVWA